MQIINIHSTETEELIGTVYSVEKINFNHFVDIVHKSFIEFHKADSYNDGDYIIEDFVDYHNENNLFKIDYCIGDYIQLKDIDVKIFCPECGSFDVETYFDCDDSVSGESRHRCRDCENIW